MADPDGLGERVTDVLAREHGDALARSDSRQRRCLAADRGRARRRRTDDLYGGRLAELRVPTLLIHGAARSAHRAGRTRGLRAALGRAWRGSRSCRRRPQPAQRARDRRRGHARSCSAFVSNAPGRTQRRRARATRPSVMRARVRSRVSRDFATPDGARLSRARRHLLHRPRRLLRRHRRAERLRQVDAAEHRRGAAGADQPAPCASTANR